MIDLSKLKIIQIIVIYFLTEDVSSPAITQLIWSQLSNIHSLLA